MAVLSRFDLLLVFHFNSASLVALSMAEQGRQLSSQKKVGDLLTGSSILLKQTSLPPVSWLDLLLLLGAKLDLPAGTIKC